MCVCGKHRPDVRRAEPAGGGQAGSIRWDGRCGARGGAWRSGCDVRRLHDEPRPLLATQGHHGALHSHTSHRRTCHRFVPPPHASPRLSTPLNSLSLVDTPCSRISSRIVRQARSPPPTDAAGPFSSPNGGLSSQTAAQRGGAGGDRDNPFADDEDPFAVADGGDPFTDASFGATNQAPSSAPAPAPAPAPTGTGTGPVVL